jgi:dienelactone hydrolase
MPLSGGSRWDLLRSANGLQCQGALPSGRIGKAMRRCEVLGGFLLLGIAAGAGGQVSSPETVIVRSGVFELHALLWRPPGEGRFPAVLFNHGSGHASGVDAAGNRDQRHPEALGPVFVRHGYVFLYLFRRGDGLSAGQGVPSADRMETAFAAGGQKARNETQVRLLETDEMDDALAGLAYLRTLKMVDAARISVVGHSFGGSLSFLVAERVLDIRAIVLFSAAGYSWDRSPELRKRLLTAASRVRAPALFVHAANDYSTTAGTALSAELTKQGKVGVLKIYPPVGQTSAEGHDFIHSRISTWEPDVFAFLDEHVRIRK